MEDPNFDNVDYYRKKLLKTLADGSEYSLNELLSMYGLPITHIALRSAFWELVGANKVETTPEEYKIRLIQ